MNSSVSRFAPNVLSCHSRYAGMYSLTHWIPAFAGMTAGWIPACACLLQAGRNDGGMASGFCWNDGGMASGLRRAATGILGGLFQTCLRQAGAALPRLG